jgi:hypothetical protein
MLAQWPIPEVADWTSLDTDSDTDCMASAAAAALAAAAAAAAAARRCCQATPLHISKGCSPKGPSQR